MSEKRQLRVGNLLYWLPPDVWRQVNDLLGPYSDDAKPLEEKKDREAVSGDDSSVDPPTDDPEPAEDPKPLGAELSEEDRVIPGGDPQGQDKP